MLVHHARAHCKKCSLSLCCAVMCCRHLCGCDCGFSLIMRTHTHISNAENTFLKHAFNGVDFGFSVDIINSECLSASPVVLGQHSRCRPFAHNLIQTLTLIQLLGWPRRAFFTIEKATERQHSTMSHTFGCCCWCRCTIIYRLFCTSCNVLNTWFIHLHPKARVKRANRQTDR